MGTHSAPTVAYGRGIHADRGRPEGVDALSGRRIDVVCPLPTVRVFASIPAAGEADVDRGGQGRPSRLSRRAVGKRCRRWSAGALPDKALPSGRKSMATNWPRWWNRATPASRSGRARRSVTATMR